MAAGSCIRVEPARPWIRICAWFLARAGVSSSLLPSLRQVPLLVKRPWISAASSPLRLLALASAPVL